MLPRRKSRNLDNKQNLSGLVWHAHGNQQWGLWKKKPLVPHSARLIASGRVRRLLCHEHTDHLTHWLSSALMTDAHIPTRMSTHTAMGARFHTYTRALKQCICTHTQRHTVIPHPPPGLIHLLHLRMPPLWCHLQSHHFKGTKALRCNQRKEQTHPLTSSFVPLYVNGYPHVERPYSTRWRENYKVCVLHSGMLRFMPTGTLCAPLEQWYFSLFLFPLTYIKNCLFLSKWWQCALRILWLQHCQLPTPQKKNPIGNAHKQCMIWWDKAIIQLPHQCMVSH